MKCTDIVCCKIGLQKDLVIELDETDRAEILRHAIKHICWEQLWLVTSTTGLNAS
jgi:hypothetical protein